MKRTARRLRFAVLAGALLLPSCSSFTSISRDQNGDYVLTGWSAPGPHGFVWICDYDPSTHTLTVKDER